MHFNLNFKSLALLLMPGLLATFPVYASGINVEYDSQKNKIAIQASNASLTSVLAEIANKTNMTIQIDPAVEKQVSFQLRPQPLQQALQKIVKGLSYVIEYKIDEKQQTVVSGLRLLPKGKQDSGQLVSVSVLNARASQIDGEGDDTSNSDNNASDYSGSRQNKRNHRPQSSLNNNQRSMSEHEMMDQDTGVGSDHQKYKRVDKKNYKDKKNQKIDNTINDPLLDPALME